MTTGSIPKVFGVKLVVIMALVASLTLCGCFTIVMNRKFAGQEEFARLYDDWMVGAPKAVAFTSAGDKSVWDSQEFNIWIPFTLADGGEVWEEGPVIRSAFRDSTIYIDSITISFLTLGDTLVRPILSWDSEMHAGEEVVDMYPSQIKGRSYLSVMTGYVTIPAEEDSISVSFTVHFRDSVGQPVFEKWLTFKLWRQEGKKLYLNVGR